jgi:hypothetical protein
MEKTGAGEGEERREEEGKLMIVTGGDMSCVCACQCPYRAAPWSGVWGQFFEGGKVVDWIPFSGWED